MKIILFTGSLLLALTLCSNLSCLADAYNDRWVHFTNLGGRAMSAGDYKKAEYYFEKSLLESKKFGSKSKEMASSINNLAGVCMQQKNFKEAESYLVLALSMREDLLGANDPQLANTCFNLGVACFKQDRINDARRYFERALDIRYSFNRDDKHLPEELAWLARTAAKQGRKDEAQELFTKAHQLKVKYSGAKSKPAIALKEELETLNSNTK